MVTARTREISRKLHKIRVFRHPEEKGVSIEICTKNTLKIEMTCHIRQVCEIEQLVEARGSSWHAQASRWHRPLRSLGIARHRMASLGTSRHPDGAPRGGAAVMVGEVRGDASDRWCGATSRASLPLTRRAVTRNGPHGGRTGAKRPLSMGNQQGASAVGPGRGGVLLKLGGGSINTVLRVLTVY